MSDLYVIYVGGKIKGSILELHDMRFVAANHIEECYGALRRSWWGNPESLHLDAWGALTYADGYEVTLSKEASQGEHSLFFVHLGAYDPKQFTEIHKNLFIVAKNKDEAKKRAKSQIQDYFKPHTDALMSFESDSILNVEEELDGFSIHLTKSEAEKPFEFSCDYVPIGG